jgi:hypothetical protein
VISKYKNLEEMVAVYLKILFQQLCSGRRIIKLFLFPCYMCYLYDSSSSYYLKTISENLNHEFPMSVNVLLSLLPVYLPYTYKLP